MEYTKYCTSSFTLTTKPGLLSQQRKRRLLPGGREKSSKKPKLSPNFANRSAMADLLRKAIAAERTADRSGGNQSAVTDIKGLWRLLSCGSQLNHLQRIFTHKRYSRRWNELGAITTRKKALLMNELGLQSDKLYLSAFKAAQRGMVWVHLCDIFENKLEGHNIVALCAFTGSCGMCIITSQDGLDINFKI